MTPFQRTYTKADLKRINLQSLAFIILGVSLALFAINGSMAMGMGSSAPIVVLGIEDGNGNLVIQGDSSVLGHEGKILAHSFTFGTVQNAPGGGPSNATFHEIQIRKSVDRASPALAAGSVFGNSYPRAVLTFLVDDITLMRVELGNVIITHVGVEHTAGNGALELVSLSYNSAEWGVNNPGGPVSECYDILQQTAACP